MRSRPKSYEEAEDQITQWLTTQQWLWPIKRTMAISNSDSSQTPFRPYPDNECWTGGVVLGVGSASGTLTPAPYLTGYSNLECFSSMLIHLGHTAVHTQNTQPFTSTHHLNQQVGWIIFVYRESLWYTHFSQWVLQEILMRTTTRSWQNSSENLSHS